jgi:TonB-dependent starch-binding outer membrane protein SusC
MTKTRLLVGMLFLCLSLSPLALWAQDRVVSGKVTDSKDGSPVVGASISAKGSKSGGTTTASDGSFTIRVAPAVSVLVVTSVGYTAQEISISGNAPVSVSLVANQTNLNEVVVVGYGTTRKKDLTGAVASVSSRDFVKGALQTPEQLITGKVAGVQITSNGGAPGAGSTIRIRGGASLNASNSPLIVIDGVPVDNGGAAGSVNPLNLINPNDIENFTILKDPSAAAIYGSRASNGVILITTKKGSAGKVRFNFSAQAFAQVRSGEVDVLTADQLREIISSKGSAGDPGKLGTENTNWQDEIYQTAFGQDLNLSARGAMVGGKLPFRVSGGFLNQDGMLKTGNFKRQTLSVNLSPRLLNNNLKVDINLKGARTTNKFADEGAIGSAIAFDPTQPVRVNSPRFGGFFEYVDQGTAGAPPRDLAPRNPVSLLEMRDAQSEVMRAIGNVQLDYTLPWVKGLRANLNVGYDYQYGNGTTKVSDSAASTYRRWDVQDNPFLVKHFGGVNNKYKDSRYNFLFDFYLNYVKDLKSVDSRIDVMAGYGYQDFYFKGYAYADYRYDGSMRPGTEPQFDTYPSEYILKSFYGRLNYTLANKYVLTMNARADGSSKYNPDDRWGFFPSAALAWRVSEENFLVNSKVVSDLKLRVGYGVTGQQDGIGFYEYLPNYSIGNNAAQYQFGNSFYNVYRPAAYDPNLRWETTTNINAAVDFGFLNNRISGSVDVFFRKTKDLLAVVPIALGTNFSNQLRTNVGNIESKGVEFTLNTIPVQTKDLTWEFGLNVTYANPEITNLLLNPDPSFKGNLTGGIAGGTGNTIQIHSVGYRPSSFYVYKQVYDNNNKPIEGLYEDINRDGIINENDLYRYKAPNAPLFMGFNSNVTYKKFSAGFVARVSVGNYIYNNVYSNLGSLRQIINPLGWIVNGSSNYLETGFTNNQYYSDYYVENASFLRMDNINVGYNAGEIYKGVTLRVSANVQNVFVITKYKGLDPELNGGIDNNLYPRPRIFALGINVDF